MSHLFQLKRKKAEGHAEPRNGRDTDPSFTVAREARHELLETITNFMVRHDLNITGQNLSVVCAALSGADRRLAEEFNSRETNCEPIDQRWLDKMARLDPGTNDRIVELEKLMDKLEHSIMRFAQTAKTAQDESCGHRGAIGRQIEQIERDAVDDSKAIRVERVIELSHAMLERLELVEEAMDRSQAETRELRSSLAEARQEADVDHLTRLPNRRAFERRLKSANHEARVNGQPLSIAFCDVDHFKQVNDRHGHEAGDRILCALADTLSEIANDECFIARHGGEEFVLLFYGLGKDEAWRKLDGVRRMMANRQLMNRETGKPFGKVTFSGGIAEVTEETNPRSALARADEALYQAKADGRNKIIAI